MHPISLSSAGTVTAQQRRDTTGLVLAGGAGQRMQGRDKGLLSWHGQPLVAHAADGLRPLVSELLVSCNRNVDRYRKLADRIVTDARGDYQGPLAGLEAASALLTTRQLLVAPCDMPGVPEAVYAKLLQALITPRHAGCDAVFLHGGGRDYYLCLAVRREALFGIARYLDSGKRSVRGWLATVNTQALVLDLPRDRLLNINQLTENR